MNIENTWMPFNRSTGPWNLTRERQNIFARGMTYAITGTTRYAEKDMSMALDLDPLNGEIWFEKGKLDEKTGKQNGCLSLLSRKHIQYGIYEAGEILDKQCK